MWRSQGDPNWGEEGWYKRPAAGGAAAYVYQGSNFISGLPAGTAQTFAITTGTSAAGSLVVAGVGLSTSKTISSVVYDPTGANVALTQDAFSNTNGIAAVYSGAGRPHSIDRRCTRQAPGQCGVRCACRQCHGALGRYRCERVRSSAARRAMR
jgi:hypothetical protein